MDFKPALEGYTEAEFLAFLEKIWAVSVSEAEHDRLVMHFDAISGHPMGADALFYGEQQGRHASPAVVLTEVRQWARNAKRQGFKGSQVNAGVTGHFRPSRFAAAPSVTAQYAERSAQRRAHAAVHAGYPADIEKKAGELDRLEQQAEDSLNRLDWLISTVTEPNASASPIEHLREVQDNREEVDEALRVLTNAMGSVFGRTLFFDASRRQAETSIKYPRRGQDPITLQAHLEALVRFQQRHRERWPAVLRYQEALLERYRAFKKSNDVEVAHLQIATGSDPALVPIEMIASASEAGSGPCLLAPSASVMKAFENILSRLPQRLLQARATLMTHASESASRLGVSTELMRFSLKLGHGERYALSIPLGDLVPDAPQEWSDHIGEDTELSVRLQTKLLKEGDEDYKQIAIYTLPGMATRVRVRAAEWSPFRGGYCFVTEGPGPATFFWLPEPAPAAPGFHPGMMSVEQTGTLYRYKEHIRPQSDDYIICFPADSGIAPLYLVQHKPEQLDLAQLRLLEEGQTSPHQSN
jgi:hypothetical protein